MVAERGMRCMEARSPPSRACPAKAAGGGHQGNHFIARIGSVRRVAQVQVSVNQLRQAKMQGHQAVVVKGDLDPVQVVAW